ncbi:MAG: hypothetical protein ACR2Q4_07330 [Geminicoccaceae bacterium]
MRRHIEYVIALLAGIAFGSVAQAQVFSEPDPNEPDHIRGTIITFDGSSMGIDTDDGQNLQIAAPDTMTVIKLSKGSFTKVDFGTYVGSVSVKLDKYSPIVRDSLSFLHDGFELRIIDEALRGIAAGHRHWDLTPESVIAHGWVDDMEGRVISVKYGPTEEEETDVEVSRDVPVLKMALGDKNLVKEGEKVFIGAQNDDGGTYSAVFIFVGEDGVVPPL